MLFTFDAQALLFKEQKAKAVAEYEEEQRIKRKMEGRFLGLLEDFFYLSDHVGTSWDDAKKVLQKRSAYDSVGKTDRKRLFQKHMEGLAAKMESKAKSIKILIDSREQQQPPQPPIVPPPPKVPEEKEISVKPSPPGPVISPAEVDGFYDIEKEMQNLPDADANVANAAAVDADADSEDGDDKDKLKDKEDKLKENNKDSKDKDKDRHSKKHKKEKKHRKVPTFPFPHLPLYFIFKIYLFAVIHKHSKRDRSQSPETPGAAAGGGAEGTGAVEGTAAKRQRSLSIDK